MQNHAHRDHIRSGQRVFEEIAFRCVDAIVQAGGRDILFRNRFDRRQIERGALEMRMSFCDFDAKKAGCTADITEGFEY